MQPEAGDHILEKASACANIYMCASSMSAMATRSNTGAESLEQSRCQSTVVIVTGGASGSMLNSNLLISMAKATTASDRAN